MPKVICSLPNASHEINGIAFEAHASGGVISKESLDADVVDYFIAVPGFALDVAPGRAVVDDAHPAADAAADRPAGDHHAAADDDAAGHDGAVVPAAAAVDAAASIHAAPKKKAAGKK